MDIKIIEERVQRAKNLFQSGYNCSQAVFGACADLFGINDEALAFRISASFGGGMGRMRKTCGAVCGMFLLEGLHTGGDLPEWDKKVNYSRIQQLASTFEQTFGSTTCATLLGMKAKAAQTENSGNHRSDGGNDNDACLAEKAADMGQIDCSPEPEKRTEAYYKKRPCVEIVGEATRIFLSSL